MKDNIELLDFFAGQALTGYIANTDVDATRIKNISEGCYNLASAMMEERKNYIIPAKITKI